MLINDQTLGMFFDKTALLLGNDKQGIQILANYLTSDLVSLINTSGIREWYKNIDPNRFAELITMIKNNLLSSRGAKDILAIMFAGDIRKPSEIAEKEKLFQQNNDNELQKIIRSVTLENESVVQEYKNGKESSLQFLIGQVMKKSAGSANPQMAASLLKKIIS